MAQIISFHSSATGIKWNVGGIMNAWDGDHVITKIEIWRGEPRFWAPHTRDVHSSYTLDHIIKHYKTNNMNITKQTMKDAVEQVANQLMTRDGNITTLFLLRELKVQYPNVFWNQYDTGSTPGVSNLFHELVAEGKFRSIANNGTYQTYVPTGFVAVGTTIQKLGKAISKSSSKKASTKVLDQGKGITIKGTKLSRTQALQLMQDNKGRFFTVTFSKKDGTARTLNGQYVAGQNPDPLGYVKVKEAGKMKSGENPIRNVNLQTLQAIKIGGKFYSVK